MTRRTLFTTLAALAVAVWSVSVASAKDEKDGDTHEGVVVKAGDGKLTMAGKDGKDEHTHDVADGAKVTIGGKAAKLGDLKKGDKIKVTTGEGKKVTKIEATRS